MAADIFVQADQTEVRNVEEAEGADKLKRKHSLIDCLVHSIFAQCKLASPLAAKLYIHFKEIQSLCNCLRAHY